MGLWMVVFTNGSYKYNLSKMMKNLRTIVLLDSAGRQPTIVQNARPLIDQLSKILVNQRIVKLSIHSDFGGAIAYQPAVDVNRREPYCALIDAVIIY